MKNKVEERQIIISGLPEDAEVELKIKPTSKIPAKDGNELINESKKVALSSLIKELISKVIKWPF